MKLDSEEQREELLAMLMTVRLSTTVGTIQEQSREVDKILDPIRYAEIEEPAPPKKQVVPIEWLAPDGPPINRLVPLAHENGG